MHENAILDRRHLSRQVVSAVLPCVFHGSDKDPDQVEPSLSAAAACRKYPAVASTVPAPLSPFGDGTGALIAVW